MSSPAKKSFWMRGDCRASLALVLVAGCLEGAGPGVGAQPEARGPETSARQIPASAPAATLAVVDLDADCELSAEKHTPARVSWNGRPFAAELKLRGRSSASYPKRSFTARFDKRTPFDVLESGFRGRRHVAFVSTFDDDTFVRQRLAFALWNRLGGVQVQTASVIVRLNGSYHGLYTAIDVVDETLLAMQGFTAKGQLWKAVDHGAGFFEADHVSDVFEKKSGNDGPHGAFSDLQEAVAFVAAADDHAFERMVAERFDLPSYRSWLTLTATILATDSLGKNAYHYRESNGRFYVVPWDFNASFGQAWQASRVSADLDGLGLARSMNRMFCRLLDVGDLGGETRFGLRAHISASGALNQVDVIRIFDALVQEVRPFVAADSARWDAEKESFGGFPERVAGRSFESESQSMRDWIIRRWSWLQMTF